MKLGDKLRSLRAVERFAPRIGPFDDPAGLASAMKSEIGRGLSQAYLSQIEKAPGPI